MSQSNYRTQPVWKKARHLALGLSLVTDTFPRDTRSQNLSRTIQDASVDLLVWIVRACESSSGIGPADLYLTNLDQAIDESHRNGLIRQSDAAHLSREIKDVSSALHDLRPSRGGGSSGGGKETDPSNPRILNPLSTGAFYD